MDNSELTKRALKYMDKYNLSKYSQEKIEEIVAAVKEPITVLSEITDSVEYFFGDDVNANVEAQDVLNAPEAKTILTKAIDLANAFDYDNHEQIIEKLGEFRKSFDGIKPKNVMWTLRAALTGRLRGADLSAVVAILGKDRVIHRIKKAIGE